MFSPWYHVSVAIRYNSSLIIYFLLSTVNNYLPQPLLPGCYLVLGPLLQQADRLDIHPAECLADMPYSSSHCLSNLESIRTGICCHNELNDDGTAPYEAWLFHGGGGIYIKEGFPRDPLGRYSHVTRTCSSWCIVPLQAMGIQETGGQVVFVLPIQYVVHGLAGLC